MTKIVCPNAHCGILEIECFDWCEICKGKGWTLHPTCIQCDMFYTVDMGFPSRVAKCLISDDIVNPLGYCHVHSELSEDK